MNGVIWGAGLLVLLAGCGQAASGSQPGAPGSGPPAAGSPVPASGTAAGPAVTVTEADGGRTVRLTVGERLHVMLAGAGLWRPPASSGPVLRLAAASGGYPSHRPADAVFVAVRAGTATVSSVTDYACLHATPACTLPQRLWSVRVVVARSR